jgi:antitoxin (DNA-binding transcriptional repressor) of toxin-antitoxin stability system
LFEIKCSNESNVGSFKMKHLEIKEEDTTLALLIDEITTTKNEIIITRNGTPIARIIPLKTKSETPDNYPLRGMPITISEDFDEAMPELWDALSQ